MKIKHILTGIVLEVVKEQKTQYRTKVADSNGSNTCYNGQFVVVGKAAIGKTYVIVD